MQFVMLLFVFRIAAIIVGLAEGLRTRGQTVGTVRDGAFSNEGYTFADFVQEFGRTYEFGSEEYTRRSSIFQESMLQIHARNSRAGRSWTAGANPFMDWTSVERAGRLHGYVPSLTRRAEPSSVAVLQTAVGTWSTQIFGQGGDSFENPTPPVRMQGACGSCWAIASAEAVEAQIMKTNSSMFQDKGSRLSIQTLLDCVQNPKHCGGNGGCNGATTELAFDFIQENGLPLEADAPYQFSQGTCNVKPYPSNWARATITGWRALPSNRAQPLMQAIVESGPVVVSVAAWKGWYHYKFGIYNDCEKDVILNHGLLAKGYGAEDQVGKYWLLQNSWGERWGEQGAIRLLRRDDEDRWCGTDTDPQQGSACDGDPRHNVTVCGSCGILYDAVVPQGGSVVFPDHAIDQNYQDVVAASDANLMLSTVGDSGAAREDPEPASKAPCVTVADEANNSFVKVQGLVSQQPELARTRDSESHVADVLPSSQELQSSLGDNSLVRVPSQSETFAPQELQSSLGDESITRPPLQSEMSAPHELQGFLGDDGITRQPSQSEMPAPQELQGFLSDDSLTGPPSPSEMRSFGVPAAMSGTPAPQELQNSFNDNSSTRPPLQSETFAPHERHRSLGDDRSTRPALQSAASAPQELPSSSGDNSLTRPSSQSETSAPRELQGVLGSSLTKREKAMLDLRRWR